MARWHRGMAGTSAKPTEVLVGSIEGFTFHSGTWVNSREHGQQFKASFLRSSAPTTAEGIEQAPNAKHRASRQRIGVWQEPGGIRRPWDFRRGRRSAAIPDGTTPDGRRYRCKEIGSYATAHELLRQGHTYLDGDGDGEACESLR